MNNSAGPQKQEVINGHSTDTFWQKNKVYNEKPKGSFWY